MFYNSIKKIIIKLVNNIRQMADININMRLIQRHDTSTNWTFWNPTLKEGEMAIETDTRYIKVGDGVSDWKTLPYTVSEINEEDIKGVFLNQK